MACLEENLQRFQGQETSEYTRGVTLSGRVEDAEEVSIQVWIDKMLISAVPRCEISRDSKMWLCPDTMYVHRYFLA